MEFEDKQVLTIVSIIASAVTIGSIIAAAVWIVASIKGRAGELRVRMEDLGESLKNVQARLGGLDGRFDRLNRTASEIAERVAKMEGAESVRRDGSPLHKRG